MKQRPAGRTSSSEQIIRDIKRKTRKQYSAEEKIRIVLDGLRGEDSIAELCRREGIAQSLYYKWSKDFMEAGKKRLAGDSASSPNATRPKNAAASPSSPFSRQGSDTASRVRFRFERRSLGRFHRDAQLFRVARLTPVSPFCRCRHTNTL